jgi:NADPH:quinone reductase-like Zn-dependent oxidoreductase
MRGYVTDPAGPSGVRLADDLPEPVPAASELVLDVRAYAINAGELRLIERRPNDFRPGQDVAGLVVRAAADGSGPAVGSRVVARVDWHGWATRVAVPTYQTAVLDDGVSYEQAATLPVAGLTALRALRLGGDLLGRNVLITGATGGVGQFAIQLAKAAGAVVTAQVSTVERAAEATALGANQVVTSLQDKNLGPFQLVLDGVGGELLTQSVRLLAPEATVAFYSSVGGPTTLTLSDFYYAGAHNAKMVAFVSDHPEETKGEDLAILARLVADGRPTAKIGWSADWEDTPKALQALANREIRGKAVLTLPPLTGTGVRMEE